MIDPTLNLMESERNDPFEGINISRIISLFTDIIN